MQKFQYTPSMRRMLPSWQSMMFPAVSNRGSALEMLTMAALEAPIVAAMMANSSRSNGAGRRIESQIKPSAQPRLLPAPT